MTDREGERRLADPEADLGLEPLPPVIDQADRRDRRMTDPCRQLHEIVELGLRRSVEDAVAAQSRKPVVLVPARTHSSFDTTTTCN